MQSAKCRYSAGVNADEAHGYGLFQLAGMLAAPLWRNGLSLAFPPSDVAALEGDTLTPGCIGLLGVAGALPYFYTEAIDRAGSPAARAFLDLLAAPAIDSFCAAWRASRPEYVPLPEVPARRGPLRARALGELLADALGVPVWIEQFAGYWHALPPSQRSALGGANPLCGAGALLGERLWRRDGAVRIHVGPLERDAARAFRPGASGALALARLWQDAVAAGAGDGRLPAETRVHTLSGVGDGGRLGAGPCLGHDALLASRPVGARDDLRYRLC
jgi:type VI secretion system protein ImpH